MKYAVYAIATASSFVGEFEADTKEEAQAKAMEAFEAPQLCHECASEMDLGDFYDFEADRA